MFHLYHVPGEVTQINLAVEKQTHTQRFIKSEKLCAELMAFEACIWIQTPLGKFIYAPFHLISNKELNIRLLWPSNRSVILSVGKRVPEFIEACK